jgi:hypothetical protein
LTKEIKNTFHSTAENILLCGDKMWSMAEKMRGTKSRQLICGNKMPTRCNR